MPSKPVVLIVEDEPGIADTPHYALATEGFEPGWCANGEAALAEARSGQVVALVILDVGLPDINGFELFKRLRALREDLPVLFLTARGDGIDRVVGLELGADDCITKPFSPRELGARVRSVLRRTAGQAADAAPPAAVPAAVPAVPAPQCDEGRRLIRYYGRALVPSAASACRGCRGARSARSARLTARCVTRWPAATTWPTMCRP